MTGTPRYTVDESSGADIAAHLQSCNANFIAALNERIPIADYARKLARHATRFEAWSDGNLVGLLAVYANDYERGFAHISNVSVLPGWQGMGIALAMLDQAVRRVNSLGFHTIGLEVEVNNQPARRLYERHDFAIGDRNGRFAKMSLNLKQE